LIIYAHESWAQSVAFSPDGSSLLTAGRDGAAKLWSASTGESLSVFQDNAGKLFRAVFNPKGASVALAGEDGVLRIQALRTSGSLEDLIALARSRVTRPMTARECRQYLRDSACPDVRLLP